MGGTGGVGSTKKKSSSSYSSPLDAIISVAKLLRTPDSVRTGGALTGGLKVLLACFNTLNKSDDGGASGGVGAGVGRVSEGREGEDRQQWRRMVKGMRNEEFKEHSAEREKHSKECSMMTSPWLWLVRLCHDRRSAVRLLALELLNIVLQNEERGLETSMEGRRRDDREGRDEGEEGDECKQHNVG